MIRMEELERTIEAQIEPYSKIARYKVRALTDEVPGDGTNFAITYDLPGGSTDQINFHYHLDGTLEYTGLNGTEVLDNLDDVIGRLESRLEVIPEKREQAIEQHLTEMLDKGMSTDRLNHWLVEQVHTGLITLNEMQQVIRRFVEKRNQRYGLARTPDF